MGNQGKVKVTVERQAWGNWGVTFPQVWTFAPGLTGIGYRAFRTKREALEFAKTKRAGGAA